MKFNIHSKETGKEKVKDSSKDEEFLTESVTESLAEMEKLEDTGDSSNSSSSSSQRLGRKYGLQPKFVKMRELHLLMFYLIYGYSGEADLDQAATKQKLKEEG